MFDFIIPPPAKVVNSFSLFSTFLCRYTIFGMIFVCFRYFLSLFFSSFPLSLLKISGFPPAALVIPGQSRYTDK